MEADTTTCMGSEKPDPGWIAVSKSLKAQWITGSTETSQNPQVRVKEDGNLGDAANAKSVRSALHLRKAFLVSVDYFSVE